MDRSTVSCMGGDPLTNLGISRYECLLSRMTQPFSGYRSVGEKIVTPELSKTTPVHQGYRPMSIQNSQPSPIQLPQSTAAGLSPMLLHQNSAELQTMAHSLRAIASQIDATPTMGFVEPPRPTWIYANRTHGDRWYWRTAEGEYALCPTTALLGHLVKLEFKEVTRREQPVTKLWATLDADRTYIIEAGKDSVFSKSLLAAIATLHPTDLTHMLMLEVAPSDQNQESLFCRVYIKGEKVYGKWGDNPDWEHIAQNAMLIVNQSHPDMPAAHPDPSPPSEIERIPAS